MHVALRGLTFWNVMLGGLLALVGCAPDDEPEDLQKTGLNESAFYSAHAQQKQPETNPPVDDRTLSRMLAEGWRPGEMEIHVSVAQAGEQADASGASGGTQTRMEWQFNLLANKRQTVLVAPDLGILLPESESATALRSAYASSPVYVDGNSQGALDGSVSYRKKMSVKAPNSTDYTDLFEVTQAQGVIDSLTVSNVQPSIYGRGYEAVLNLSYHLTVGSTRSAQLAGGDPSQVTDTKTTQETLRMHLFPAPDIAVLKHYPFEQDPDLPAELRESEYRLALDIFQGLRDAMAGKIMVGDLRPGMTWRGTRDKLTLTYSLSGNSQPPLYSDVSGLATAIFPNDIHVEIIITATP